MRGRLPISFQTFATIAGMALLGLCGCGSTTYPSLNGSWKFVAVSSVLQQAPPQTIDGTLTSSGSSVTGTLTFSNACFKNQALTYSGSIGDDNVLKLTSATYSNQVVALSGTVSSDGTLLTSGTYTVSPANISQGICDTGDTGSLTGSR